MNTLRHYEELLAEIEAIDTVAYAKTRNHLSGAVTKLSPYISRGVLTLPVIRDRLRSRVVSTDCEKLIQELAWREYFQQVWWAKGEAIFSDLRFPRTDWHHHELVTALVDGATGIEVIDQGIHTLYQTGYMHNHLRMWVASIGCNIARAHWLSLGQWMYYHLADGDLASNFLSWQWVAGTSVSKRYTTSQELITGCSASKQTNTWLSIDREKTLTMPIPEALLAHEPFQLVMEYPDQSPLVSVAGANVCLYTPWTLDPQWRRGQNVRRILIIDPQWFNRFPVSVSVMDFIIRQGKLVIPELEIFVGAPTELPGIAEVTSSYYKAHPTNLVWPGVADTPERMFPQVVGYYKSFFTYWQECQLWL